MLGYKVLGRGHLNRQDDTSKALVRDGITMYDFRHNSVCHYLPIYKSENQMKYRYGWTKADMIAYYSEFMGMKDTITDADMITDSSKVGLQIELDKANQRAALMQEQMNAQKADFDERMKKIETMMLQKFADNF
jgi:hypothetical protein